MSTPKHEQTQDTKTKTDLHQVNRMITGQIGSVGLPQSMLSATPPPVISYPDTLAYPNMLIRKGNVIYPAQDLSFPLYYLPEATYYSNACDPQPMTQLYKRHGTMHERDSTYTTIGSEPKYYTAFAEFYVIKTDACNNTWRLSEKDSQRALYIGLKTKDPLGSSEYTLCIFSNNISKAVHIQRSTQPETTSENVCQKIHSWVDSTTNKVLAWEFRTKQDATLSASASEPSSNEEYRLEFGYEAFGKQLRDILTAAWCISLWIDVELARRRMEESKEKPMGNKGMFGRLAKLWQNEERSVGSSKPERNEVREQLGLDEPWISEEPKELMWYEKGEKS